MCVVARHLRAMESSTQKKINLGYKKEQKKFQHNQDGNLSSRIIVLWRERLSECFANCFGCGIEFDKVVLARET